MSISVNIGATAYSVPQQGERGWGANTTTLLVKLAQVADQVVQSNLVLTSNYVLQDVSGNFGLQSNFVRGVGVVATTGGFVRMASPHANPGQGNSFPAMTPIGISNTYVSWRNSLNTADLHLFPNSDNATLQFAGHTLVDLDSTQSISGKTITGGTINNAVVIQKGTADHVAIIDGTGVLASEAQLSTARGGLGADFSAATGFLKATGGSFTTDTIVDADVAVGANIDASKIGTGVVSNTEFNHLDGVTSAIQTQIDAKISSTEKGAANGVASLDSGGKVPVSQLPNSIMEYKGTWNASTNSPSLADGSGNTGDVYRVTVAGSQNLGSGVISFEVGDYAIYNSSGVWEKADTTDAVSSVNGFTGAVVLAKGDVGLGNVDNTSDLNKPVSTATQTALNLKANSASPTLVTPTVDDYLDVNEESAPSSPGAGKVRVYAKTDKKLYKKGSDGIESQVGGGGLVAVSKTTTYTAVSGDMVEANTTSGGFTITLPGGTSAAAVGVMDALGTFYTNNLIVAPATGQSIDSYAANDTITMDVNYSNAIFYREEGSTVWRMQRQALTLYSPGFVPGYTGGAAISAGNIGEKITWTTPPSDQALTTTESDWTNATITITPGVWLVQANVYLYIVAGATAGNNSTGYYKVTDTSNAIVQNIWKSVYSKTSGTSAGENQICVSGAFVVSVSVNTTYKIRSYYANSVGTGSGSIVNSGSARSEFFAIRIA